MQEEARRLAIERDSNRTPEELARDQAWKKEEVEHQKQEEVRKVEEERVRSELEFNDEITRRATLAARSEAEAIARQQLEDRVRLTVVERARRREVEKSLLLADERTWRKAVAIRRERKAEDDLEKQRKEAKAKRNELTPHQRAAAEKAELMEKKKDRLAHDEFRGEAATAVCHPASTQRAERTRAHAER